MIVFILQMGKLRHKNEQLIAQCHIASKWLSKDLNTKILKKKKTLPRTTYIHYLFNKYLTSTATF